MKAVCLPVVLLAVFLPAGCARSPSPESPANGGAGAGRPSLSLAEQFGLAYAPLQILRQQGSLERALPNTSVRWHRLGNTAAIREAMVAGRVDAGFVAIPPFLIGRDAGMTWRIFTGLSEAPLALITWKPELRTLSDIGPADRIALPQPASVQHILLAMAAERQLGESRRFDRQMLTMAHPDAMTALLARGDIAAHFSSPPYLARELAEPGMHAMLTGIEAMGQPFTFIVGVATERALAERADQILALTRGLAEAATLLREQPAEAAALLAPLYGLPPAELEADLRDEGLRFGPEIRGLSGFAEFMHRQGFLQRPAGPAERLIWSDAPSGGPVHPAPAAGGP